MGQITANMGIYIPDAGETNYDQSFAAGMNNIDVHDHSGGPNKGVPLSASALQDGSVTKTKLNADVVSPGEGLAIDLANPNALKADGLLNSLYKLAVNGFLVRTGAGTSAARTITGRANEIGVNNGDGVAGNPEIFLTGATTATSWTPVVLGSAVAGAGTYTIQHGRYVRLGTLTIAVGQITWTAHTGNGDMIVSGFPVTFGSSGTAYISTLGFADITLPAGTIQVALDGNNNDTTANVVGYRDAGTAQNVQLGGTGNLQFTLVSF